jgi:hypothetical protein
MDELVERLRQYQANNLPDCPLCVNWFLGCLNGRQNWTDKAVHPNFRFVGVSGKEYSYSIRHENIPGAEYPLRMFCDAFEWDPKPERLGRVVYED